MAVIYGTETYAMTDTCIEVGMLEQPLSNMFKSEITGLKCVS